MKVPPLRGEHLCSVICSTTSCGIRLGWTAAGHTSLYCFFPSPVLLTLRSYTSHPRALNRTRIFISASASMKTKLGTALLYRHTTSLYCSFFYCTSQTLFVLETEDKTSHQQKDDDSLYCNTRFITVVWN